MNAQQKVKYLILATDAGFTGDEPLDYATATGESIDAAYGQLEEDDQHWDAISETRGGEVETGIPCQYSRHYEAKSVASKLPDGSWVGWTYWYGGGKHGEPEAIDWMEDAYDLSCVEEEKLVTVRTFTKADEAEASPTPNQ